MSLLIPVITWGKSGQAFLPSEWRTIEVTEGVVYFPHDYNWLENVKVHRSSLLYSLFVEHSGVTMLLEWEMVLLYSVPCTDMGHCDQSINHIYL